MKQKFSTKWKASKQPRKQRKYRANAPLHIRKKFVSAHLSLDLRKKHGRRSFALKKGDNVKIMIGEFKRKTGNIGIVDLTKSRVSIEGLQRLKKDGTKVNVWFNPSNLLIQELNLEDKKRLISLERNRKETKEVKEKAPQFQKLPKTEKPKEIISTKKSEQGAKK